MPVPAPQIPPRLRETVLRQTCVAFIGSGISADSYPSWSDLVNKLCEYCGSDHCVRVGDPEEAYLDAAQDAKDSARDKYFSFLGETFGNSDRPASLTYDALLALPFESYLTVNFDPLLALKARTAHRPCAAEVCAYPSLDRRKMGNRSIHYLHGLINVGDIPIDGTIVLARDEFEAAYQDTSPLMDFLVPALENDPLIFLGCRLREPVMERVFRICKNRQRVRQDLAARNMQPTSCPPRFIFLPRPEPTSDGKLALAESRDHQVREEAHYRNMNIEPVWYNAPSGNHSQLRHLLEDLAGLKRPIVKYGLETDSHV